MDLNRLTEKAQDAIRHAQGVAQRQGHPQVDAEHLAVALLTQDGGVAPRVVAKAGGSPAALAQRLQQALERMPRVSAPAAQPGQVYVSPRLTEVLSGAEAEAQRMSACGSSASASRKPRSRSRRRRGPTTSTGSRSCSTARSPRSSAN